MAGVNESTLHTGTNLGQPEDLEDSHTPSTEAHPNYEQNERSGAEIWNHSDNLPASPAPQPPGQQWLL